MKFKNRITNELITHVEFVSMVWEETERQFNDLHDECWCNLTQDEQIKLYCEQYEHQLNCDWKLQYGLAD